ncbi:MAG: hypothetical protein Nk1A_5810 [Endomicrobiia bacterium]|nr:MAG: hypothetical protein Nk1A_5810 [Endomicrobiia bacterium]
MSYRVIRLTEEMQVTAFSPTATQCGAMTLFAALMVFLMASLRRIGGNKKGGLQWLVFWVFFMEQQSERI